MSDFIEKLTDEKGNLKTPLQIAHEQIVRLEDEIAGLTRKLEFYERQPLEVPKLLVKLRAANDKMATVRNALKDAIKLMKKLQPQVRSELLKAKIDECERVAKLRTW